MKSSAASLPSHSPKLGHKSYHSSKQPRNHRSQSEEPFLYGDAKNHQVNHPNERIIEMSAINQQRHHQTNARYPDRVDSPIVSSNPTQSNRMGVQTGYDPRYIDV